MARIACWVLLALSVSIGCSRSAPSGFWVGYQADSIAGQFSDQGPWGGTQWVQWTAKDPHHFTITFAMHFAASNGWKCAPPVKYTASQIQIWRFGEKPVFPLHFGPADRKPDSHAVEEFPRHIDDDSLVSQCETGWIRVAPGSGQSSPAYGYIQINEIGTRMAIYHLWGEI